MTGLAAADAAGTPNTAELGAMQVEQSDGEAAGSDGLAEDTGRFAVRNTNDLGGGAMQVAEELPLDGIAQGDYELVLRVEDKATGQTRERIEPLRITHRIR